MKHHKFVVALGSLSLMAACGGGGGTNSGPVAFTPETFVTTLTADKALVTKVIRDPIAGTGYFATQATQVPTSGSVGFTGIGIGGLIDPNTPERDLLVRGDAAVTVNFDSDAISGTVTNLQVAEFAANAGENDAPTGVFGATGTITLSNGAIGTSNANAIAADFDGTVQFSNVTAVLDGRMSGNLRGTRPNPNAGQSVIRAINMSGTGQTIVDGTTTYSSDLSIIAESQ